MKQASRNEAVGPKPRWPRSSSQAIRPGARRANATPSSPAVTTERRLQLWLTPHGFERRAGEQCDGEEERQGDDRDLHRAGKYRVVGTISAFDTSSRRSKRSSTMVLGDMIVETTYSDYRDFGGLPGEDSAKARRPSGLRSDSDGGEIECRARPYRARPGAPIHAACRAGYVGETLPTAYGI